MSLFGHTRLPVTEVELLLALGESRDVHIWLPQPSPRLWDELTGIGGVVRRADDDSARQVRHPLLASLGRDSRELRRTLDAVPARQAEVAEPGEAHRTLLGWLQSDLRANAVPDAEARAARTLDPTDRSVQVHACHGPARQVDVLREVLVGLLEDDTTLEPRDILVMCPDIETYAPLISAGFGLADVVDDGEAHPAHRLRVRLADRALTSTNPLLAVAATLVRLAGGRVTASEVLDLATADPVRARFRLSDDDLARVTGWVADAGIRWGLDADQRADFSMTRFGHNTWRSGIDRILLGVVMSGDDHRNLGRGLPLDDVGSSDIELAGRLAELLARLERCVDALSDARAVGEWMTGLHEGVRSLTETPRDDAWQLPQFERELARAVESAGERRRRRPAAGRRPRPPGVPPGWTSHAGQLPYRDPHGLHHGPDAVRAAPRGLPGRSGRRGLPAHPVRRRRRRAGPAADDRGARRAERGQAAAPRRRDGRLRDPRGDLHRRQRAHGRDPAPRRAARRDHRRPRPDLQGAGA